MSKISAAFLILGLFTLSPAFGQDVPASTTQPASSADNGPVTREEFNQLKAENAQMKKELDALKQGQNQQQQDADQNAQDLSTQIDMVRDIARQGQPGLENFTIVGDAAVGYQQQRGSPSTFSADVSPLILWQPPDRRMLVEFAFDLGIDGQDVNSETTTASLNLADLSYDVCDYLTIGGGLFAVPFGQFHNHFDPPWINKFPDDPLAFDAIAPVSEVGFFAKGAIPSGTTRWTYDVYVTNGPNLITNDPAAAGQLSYDDYTDLNNNKAVGGRIGFLPLTDMDMGYSLQFSQPNPQGFKDVHAFAQAVDFHYKPTINAIGGQVDLKAEWIWMKVGSATYDPNGSLGFGPLTFGSYNQGGYVSIGYRATQSDNPILRNLEYLFRFDSLQMPTNAPGGDHESRYTLGVDYWLTSYCVAKVAYEIDSKKIGPDQNTFLFQLGFGL